MTKCIIKVRMECSFWETKIIPKDIKVSFLMTISPNFVTHKYMNKVIVVQQCHKKINVDDD